MTTVGLFAGRGDVVLAIGLGMLVGGWVGWRLRGVSDRLMATIRQKAQPKK